jgi:hypothetical protein
MQDFFSSIFVDLSRVQNFQPFSKTAPYCLCTHTQYHDDLGVNVINCFSKARLNLISIISNEKYRKFVPRTDNLSHLGVLSYCFFRNHSYEFCVAYSDKQKEAKVTEQNNTHNTADGNGEAPQRVDTSRHQRYK